VDSASRELIRASMRHLLETTPPAGFAAALLESGWGDLLADGPDAITMLAEEQGRVGSAAPLLDLVLLHGAGLPVDAVTAFVLPPLERDCTASARLQDGGLRVGGLLLNGSERAHTVIACSRDGLAAVPAEVLDVRAISGFDPALGLRQANALVPAGSWKPVGDAAAWSRALATGRTALAVELIGLAERMLADTVDYVLAREQFGRPIGSFQAVKHKLADARVAISAARAAVQVAVADGDPLPAMAAKCLAGRAHQLVSTHGHQVHGGIAFTVEHGFHRSIRRGLLLDGLLGTSEDLVRNLGGHILASKSVPRIPALL
jgi:hypothetical protein